MFGTVSFFRVSKFSMDKQLLSEARLLYRMQFLRLDAPAQTVTVFFFIDLRRNSFTAA